MRTRPIIGALVLLFAVGAPAQADWQTRISGAKPILPTRFTPMGYLVLEEVKTSTKQLGAPDGEADEAPILNVQRWSAPLVDRTLSPAEKAANLAPELQEAIMRIVPMYDPTRLGDPSVTPAMSVSSGTAAMNNVFADRWQLADSDVNVNMKTDFIAKAWQRPSDLPCDAYTKTRPHPVGQPALTELSEDDCLRLKARTAYGFRDPPPFQIVVAILSLPIFAAPLPGSRLSSRDFWAAQKTRIMAIEAELHRKWAMERSYTSGYETYALRR